MESLSPEEREAIGARARELLAASIARDWRSYGLSKFMARKHKSAWRSEERRAYVKPVSDKVAFYNPRVDMVAAVKPRGRGK